MYFEKEILDKIPTEYLLSSFEATKVCMRNQLRDVELTDKEIVELIFRPNFNDWAKEKCVNLHNFASDSLFEMLQLKRSGELTDKQETEFISTADDCEKGIKKYEKLVIFNGVWEGYLTALCNTYLGRYILSGGSCVAEINVADEYLFTIDNEKITVAGSFGAKREIDYRKNIKYYDCLFGKGQPSNNNDDNWDK